MAKPKYSPETKLAVVNHYLSGKDGEQSTADLFGIERTSVRRWVSGFAPIFPDTCYHFTHYWPAAADIPVASDNPAHYADAIRYNARTPLQGSLLPLTRLVWA